MHKIKLILLGLVAPFSGFYVHAEELQYINDGTIHYYCDDKKSIFYFLLNHEHIIQIVLKNMILI